MSGHGPDDPHRDTRGLEPRSGVDSTPTRTLRLLPAPEGGVEVTLSPSLVRMSAASRLAVAAALAALVWTATLSVIG